MKAENVPPEGVVVVTGGNGRFGRILVPRLREAGYVAVPVSRPRTKAEPAGAPGADYIADLLDESSVDSCFDAIRRDLGPIYGLIHAAGGWGKTEIATSTQEAWEFMVRTNLVSAFLCFQAAVRRMDDGGRLIAFASRQGADCAASAQSAYSAAKAGVIKLVESAAQEFADQNVTAHAIAPSTILYETDDGTGVHAEDLVALCLHILSPAGGSTNGRVVRAYGK